MTNLRFLPGAAALLLGTLVSFSPAAASPPGPQAAAPAPPGASQESAPQFPSGVDLVTVDAIVLDKNGDPVEGLTRDDFVVKEQGRVQTINSFDAVTLSESPELPGPTSTVVSTNVAPQPPKPPRTFMIVFDDVHMAPERLPVAREAVKRFVTSSLSPGDDVTLVPTSGGAWWSVTLPEGRDDLLGAMDRLQGLRPRDRGADRISDWEAMMLYVHRDKQVGAEVIRRYYEHRLILEPPGVEARADLDLGEGHPAIRAKSAQIYTALTERRKRTLAVLERVADSLALVKGRKTIVLVSEGFIFESLPEFRDLEKAAVQASAAVYFLDVRGLSGLPLTADAEISEPTDERDLASQLRLPTLEGLGAETIAANTGGRIIKNKNDLAKGLQSIARESRAFYLLGYQSTDPARDGKFRKIEVEVRGHPDVTVRARRGYYAPSDDEERKADPDALDPRVKRALDSPFELSGIPLRLTSYVLRPAANGKISVLLVAEADPSRMSFEEKGGRFEASLDSFAVVSSRETGQNQNVEKHVALSLPPDVKRQLDSTWLPLAREFTLAPGSYQARVLLKDERSGRVGNVRHTFHVPPLDALRTTTPILTDALQQTGAGQPPRPIPIAHRTFVSGRTLYYVFEVLGAEPGAPGEPPQVTAGYRLEDGTGQVLGTQAPVALIPGPDGSISQMFAVSLRGVDPGDYAIRLEVKDGRGGQTIEWWDPFVVTASAAASASASPAGGK